MKWRITLAIYVLCMTFLRLRAQQETVNGWGLNIQYAGSTGFVSIGYLRQLANKKIELGMLYGYTPGVYGGPLHSVTLKVLYNPWRIPVGSFLVVEPLQAGVFFSQHFGKDLEILWSRKQYPPLYYWWPRTLRSHPFISTAVSLQSGSKWFHRLTWYFEGNTNDLYIASYSIKQNHKSLSLYDIVYFGSGIKVYLR